MWVYWEEARLLRDVEDVSHGHVPLNKVTALQMHLMRLELVETHKDVDWHEPHGLLCLEEGSSELVGWTL